MKKALFHLSLCECFSFQCTLEKSQFSWINCQDCQKTANRNPARIRKLNLNLKVGKSSFSNCSPKVFIISVNNIIMLFSEQFGRSSVISRKALPSRVTVLCWIPCLGNQSGCKNSLSYAIPFWTVAFFGVTCRYMVRTFYVCMTRI